MIVDGQARLSRALRFWPDTFECTGLDDSVPWFVAWLAALHSSKHRYTMRTAPNVKRLHDDLSQFVSRTK